MIEKLNIEIEEIKKQKKTNDQQLTKLFELLNENTIQMQTVQNNLEKLQLQNEKLENELIRLNIVKEYFQSQS